MRLTLADAMVTRLSGNALAAWAAAYMQTLPRIMVGYERPRDASDWPFVALVPVEDRRDLINGTLETLTMSMVCGVRVQDPDQAAGVGLRAVDALSEACLVLLSTPPGYAVGTRHLVTDTAELTESELIHPHYQIEVAISLRLVGPAR